MKKVAFFLSANDLDKKYSVPALELVKLIVELKYGFVYGGTNKGLMSEASDLVKSLGGHITAISSKEFALKLKKGADEEYMCEDVADRKRKFIEYSDAFIALPGGMGTLDEITEVIAKRKLDLLHKPIAFLNIDGFWDGLIKQINDMYKHGFSPYTFEDMCFSSSNPKEIMGYIEKNIEE
ncbi:MAG: TIGR00730 family Rossman fold protein [bacterium]|nr:TIGR00730 family Rossman fold protein [bacterium]